MNWELIAFCEAILLGGGIVLGLLAGKKIIELGDHSITDTLTGLGNRRALDRALTREINRSQRYGSRFTVVFVDLDRFKAVNDNHGHISGDKLLVKIADILKVATRDSDLAVRYGGDEFIVLLAETDKIGGQIVAEKIREMIKALPATVGFGVTASIGLADFPGTVTEGDPEAIIRLADNRAYVAKEAGGNIVVSRVELPVRA